MTNASVEETAKAWLHEMEACVRDVDFTRARHIFSPEVVGFGSFSAMLVGLDELERDQWRRVWPAIRAFTFDTNELRCETGGDFIWIACPWTSEGQAADGSWRDRPGRMTAVLKRVDDRWLAIHTHFSQAPSGTITVSM
jgi:ketosteroid isomerase-like protein